MIKSKIEITEKQAKRWARFGSRAVFGMAIKELLSESENLYILSADMITSSGLTPAKREFPDKLIDVGIAEQNLVGIAAGMANENNTIFISTIAPFMTIRAAEQIRMNLGYMQMNVKFVGIGSGLAFGDLGNSHFCFEDVSLMRAIPGITILSPADAVEIYKVVYAAANFSGPVYIRLTGAAPSDIVYKEDYDFQIGKAVNLTPSNEKSRDIAIFATGSMVSPAIKAAEFLKEKNIYSEVYNFHTIKPLDEEIVKKSLDKKLIVTIEEHSVVGGLGSAVL
ncbi:MAG: transketolase, partial [Clostridiales Family XIII bacterium]|nr:transketolase [Clostridiales Family XIII bacterium]